MAIADLTKVVATPSVPVDAGSADRRAVIEAKLKTALPADYWEFAARYGTGCFNDPGRLVITVFNPFAPDYLKTLKRWLGELRDCFEDEEVLFDGKEREGFPVFPRKRGLFPWGSDDNGNGLYWYTSGPPDSWPVVFHAHDADFAGERLERYDLPMTVFLAKAFTREAAVAGAWGKPFFSGRRKVKFAQLDSEIEYQ